MTLREPNSELHWASTRPEDNTPAIAVAVGHFVQVGLCLRTESAPRASVAVKNEDCEFGIRREFRDPDGLAPQYPLSVPRRMRPAAEPHDLGRWPDCGGEFVEAGAGAPDHEVPCLGKLPYLAIRAFEQAGLRSVDRIRGQFSEPDDELAREVLVKQQLHRATRLPTRAANSYTARKSSGSSSG